MGRGARARPCARIGGKRVVEAERQQRLDLFERARLDHAVEARIDAGIKRLALRRDDEPAAQSSGASTGRGWGALPLGERDAGRIDHFERARRCAADRLT